MDSHLAGYYYLEAGTFHMVPFIYFLVDYWYSGKIYLADVQLYTCYGEHNRRNVVSSIEVSCTIFVQKIILNMTFLILLCF